MTNPVNDALVSSKYMENTQTTQYTAVAVTAIVDLATFTNVSASAVTFSLHIVDSGDTAGGDNKIISSKEVPPGRCYIADEACHTLTAGQFISTLCSDASALVMRISGREVT